MLSMSHPSAAPFCTRTVHGGDTNTRILGSLGMNSDSSLRLRT